ncbi:hypothetical protein BDW42DRAFT_143254 [Aspergillus taichungensis]|uniref:Uncharacterized protein n=1 Tax=Aspergillus taichungensis TaxID=482145 RepID=A0A2J5HMZ4_9EURO|nr:hypothetical protein BDW42DRAFT_143254 [Aspergillus taichungensis]
MYDPFLRYRLLLILAGNASVSRQSMSQSRPLLSPVEQTSERAGEWPDIQATDGPGGSHRPISFVLAQEPSSLPLSNSSPRRSLVLCRTPVS